MNKELVLLISIIVAFIVVGAVFFGDMIGTNRTRNEARERGLLVQCLGKDGWHWECEKGENAYDIP